MEKDIKEFEKEIDRELVITKKELKDFQSKRKKKDNFFRKKIRNYLRKKIYSNNYKGK